MATENSIRVLFKVLDEMKPVDLEPEDKYFQLAKVVVNTPWIGRLCAGQVAIEKLVRDDKMPKSKRIWPLLLKLQKMLQKNYKDEFKSIELFTSAEKPKAFYASVSADLITCEKKLFSSFCDMGVNRDGSSYVYYTAAAIEMSCLPEAFCESREIKDPSFEVKVIQVGRVDGEDGLRREIIGLNGQLEFKVDGKKVSKKQYFAADPRKKRARA